MRCGLALIGLLAACDKLFDLEHVETRDATSGDADSADTPNTCPPTYDQVIATLPSRYRLRTVGMQFAMADNSCADVAGKTHLLVIETLDELTAIRAHILANPASYWVGLLQRAGESSPSSGWFWVTTMAPPDPAVWLNGEPSDQDGIEDNAQNHGGIEALRLSVSDPGLLNDRVFGTLFGAFCECDP